MGQLPTSNLRNLQPPTAYLFGIWVAIQVISKSTFNDCILECVYFQKAHGTFPTYLNSFEACQMLIRPAEDQWSSQQPGIEKQKHSCSQWKSEKKCRQLRDFNKGILVDPSLRRVALKRKAFLKLGARGKNVPGFVSN